MERVASVISEYISAFRLPKVEFFDVVEILILAFILYEAMVWVKNTRAWAIVKGLAIVLVFMAVAVLFNMTTIIWLAKSLFTIISLAVIVALQPEIRRLIEEGRFSDKTLNEIIVASYEMGRVKTGALIVIEHDSPLGEYERTGIAVDAVVTSQLLINIFEHNTPLHDGAVIVRGDRVAAATCYLPLSDQRTLSKDLGTRHRAAVGISENTDSMTVVVSEETGKVSVAYGGELYRALDAAELREKLEMIQDKKVKDKKFGFLKKEAEKTDEEKLEEAKARAEEKQRKKLPKKYTKKVKQEENEGKTDSQS